MSFVIIYHQGKIYRIPKIPFETEQQASDRAWYIAKHDGQESNYAMLQSNAAKEMYQKYFRIKY
jgi:hypothetical protein